MKLRLVEAAPDMVSVRIELVEPSKDGLKTGDWEIVRTSDGVRIELAIDRDKSIQEISNQFLRFAKSTGYRWGAVPVIDFKGFEDIAPQAAHGLALYNYRLDAKKTSGAAEPGPSSLYILSHNLQADEMNRAEIEAEVRMRVMELVDLPPNVKTPEFLGQWARASAKKYGFDCEVWNDDHVIAAKLFALHAVGRGSVHDPVFIVSKYFGKKDDTSMDLSMVGKGVTFDSGGISIKPSTNMHYMKSDMAGGAAVLGAIELAARLKLPINVSAIVPAAENAVDGNSLLPGEIIDTYSGKTVEVIDTDAEGRLILADALAWTVRNIKPKRLVDLATLTGSSVRALGNEAAALYSKNETLRGMVYEAGQESGEKCCSMPLWEEYVSYIESDVADVANLPLKPIAGSIAAAKFLEVFVDDHDQWAHLDMPGMAFQSTPFAKNKSATGYGIGLLSNFMMKLANG